MKSIVRSLLLAGLICAVDVYTTVGANADCSNQGGKVRQEALAFKDDYDKTYSVKYYLSGKDKDNTVKWKFKCSKGSKAEIWDSIKVPSNWELEGFGEYRYGYDTWNHKAEKPEDHDIGTYQYTFFVPEDLKANILILSSKES